MVWKKNWLDLRINTEKGSLKWVNSRAVCLDLGVCFCYDHKSFALPFGFGFKLKELKGSYSAVIAYTSAKETPDRRTDSGDIYGIFWYDSAGKVKAICCGHLSHQEYVAFFFNPPSTIRNNGIL